MKITRLLLMFMVIVTMMMSVGCMKPYKKEVSVDVESYETAIVVPLEMSTKSNQVEFESVDYLRERKVATKRIILAQRWKKTGRLPASGEWIPLERVIKINRTPVSCQWTAEDGTGTSTKKESFEIETVNSIAFEIGATMTCRIIDAPLYLYRYPGNINLSNVANNQIYRRAMGILTAEFGMYDLDGCRKNKAEIFKKAEGILKEDFIKDGIEITQLNLSGQLKYEDHRIQENINDEFISKNNLEIERNKRLAGEETRLNEVAEAENRLKVAKIFQKAIKAETERTKLKVMLLDAETRKIEAEKWNGQKPYIQTSSNTPMILNTKDIFE